MKIFWLFNFFLHFFIWVSTLFISHALTPQPAVQCSDNGCTLQNSYGVWGDRKFCKFSSVKYPTTEEEIRLAVAYANKNNLKLKVVSKFSHTIPKLACADEEQSSTSLLISTINNNSNIVIDEENLAVTVDSGVGLRELIDQVERVGLSLVAAPYWEGVSVGGLISTGAHGSSWWGKGGSVHDHVIGISLVVPAKPDEGYAKIMKLEEKDSLFSAAKVSLGVLGVISKVKLSLERRFKRSISYNFTDDAEMEDLYREHAKKYEFADITWYPSKHKAVYRYDRRVALNVSGDGVYDFIGFQPNSILISSSIRAIEKAFEKGRNDKGKCTMASSVVEFKKLVGNGLKNNGLIFTGYPVVGFPAKMQTSGSCLYSTALDMTCAWDPRIKGLFFYETTAIFTPSSFDLFVKDVKSLRDLNPEKFCGVDLYNGFLIRFIKGSDAFLGQSEDSVVVDFNYYRSDEASDPRLNQDVWEEVEQMAFFKYGARPHWGKNRNLGFLNVREKYPNFDKFLWAKKRLDPRNMMSSEWSDKVLLGLETENGDGCALEGHCVCSEDRHCRPEKGYSCREGLVYEKARVCRFSPSSSIEGRYSFSAENVQ